MLNNVELNIVIQGCIKKNRRSQEDLYKLFYGFSAAVCLRYIHNKEDLTEVLNDGFFKVYKELETFNMPIANGEVVFKAWVRRIMINTSIDYYRKFIKNEPNIIEVNDDFNNVELASETPLQKMSYDNLLVIINKLTPMYKIVFNMYIIDGMSHQEIAEELKISVGTSKSNLSKARQNVIKLIESKS